MSIVQIQLRPEVEAELTIAARERGLSLEGYIEKILSTHSSETGESQEVTSAIDAIRKLREGLH